MKKESKNPSEMERQSVPGASGGNTPGTDLSFSANPLPMILVAVETQRVLAANHAAVVHYGYSMEEFSALRFEELFCSYDHPMTRCSLGPTSRDGGNLGVWRHYLRDGSIRMVEMHGFPLVHDGVNAWAYVLIDRTEQLETAKETEALKNLYDNLVNNIPGVVFRLTRTRTGNFRLTYISPRFERDYGKTAEKIKDQPESLLRLIQEEDRAGLVLQVAQSARDMNEVVWEGRILLPSRPTFWLRIDARPTPGDSGEVHWDGFATDVTDRRLLERVGEQRQRLLEESQRIASMGSWEYDVNMGVLRWSDQLFRLLGREAQSFQPKLPDLYKHLHEEDREEVRSAIDAALAGQRKFNWTARSLDPAGKIRWLTCQGEATFEGRQLIHLVGIVQDVTGEMEKEIAQKTMDDRMQQASRFESLSVLAGGIAHDFNNLLAGILGYVDLALGELSPVAPGREYVTMIEKSTLRAAELTRQMLAYSGRGHFIIESINLTTLVEEMSHLLQTVITRKAVLRLDFHREIPHIEADKTQIRQIIMNLIINASEAIGERSGIITLRTGAIQVSREYLQETWLDFHNPDGVYTFFEVSDTGCGMNDETVKHIFDPFFTTKDNGHGLGLAAVLGIIRGHNGFIKVYSEPGRGTTFKVGFPAIDEKEQPMQETDISPAKMDGGLVLVADDEETIRAITGMLLAKMGFETIVAADGTEALEIFRERHQDLCAVLLDLTMPRLSGDEVFREIRNIDESVPVILMSGFTEDDAVREFLGKGLAGFLQKPFRLQELRDKLHESLGIQEDG
ncbi:MAG: PAS domain-containing protein [Candidatus Sumerlaeia bacterium]|nr:PAS domain-containing protein [Candidatus Sumerlaeia bacterium]